MQNLLHLRKFMKCFLCKKECPLNKEDQNVIYSFLCSRECKRKLIKNKGLRGDPDVEWWINFNLNGGKEILEFYRKKSLRERYYEM